MSKQTIVDWVAENVRGAGGKEAQAISHDHGKLTIGQAEKILQFSKEQVSR